MGTHSFVKYRFKNIIKRLVNLKSSTRFNHKKRRILKKHIGESGRIISDIMKIVKQKKVGRFSSWNGHWKSIWFLRS